MVNHTPLALETLFHLNITQFLGTVPSDSDSDRPHVSCKIEPIYSNTHRNCFFFYPSDGKYLRIEDSHVYSFNNPALGFQPWTMIATSFRVQWNSAFRTPVYDGQLRLFQQKAHIYSLKLTRLIRIPDIFQCPEIQTSRHRQPRITDTVYLSTVYHRITCS